MIPIQLPSGKTVFVKTIDQLLNFDYQNAMADDDGYEVNDPFFASSLQSKTTVIIDVLSVDLPDIIEIEEINLDESEEEY